ncbi:MAG: AAA family ATPase, partial [Candidatus Omnitrophica bacterium]|nr:AAA family ATPase [Candidatus Omnitrophota bacterium]
LEELFSSDEERELYRHVKVVRLLKRLFEIQLTGKDVSYLRENIDKIDSSASPQNDIRSVSPQNDISSASPQNPHTVILNEPKASEESHRLLKHCRSWLKPANNNFTVLIADAKEALEFYEIAERRNHAMFTNTVRAMRREGKHAAALISGGHHSEGLTGIMKEKGLSYIVLMPKYTAGEERPYVTILTKKTGPYRELAASGAYETLALETYFDTGDIEAFEEMLAFAVGQIALDGGDVEEEKRAWIKSYTEYYNGLSGGRKAAMKEEPIKLPALIERFDKIKVEKQRRRGDAEKKGQNVEVEDKDEVEVAIGAKVYRVTADSVEVVGTEKGRRKRYPRAVFQAAKENFNLFLESLRRGSETWIHLPPAVFADTATLSSRVAAGLAFTWAAEKAEDAGKTDGRIKTDAELTRAKRVTASLRIPGHTFSRDMNLTSIFQGISNSTEMLSNELKDVPGIPEDLAKFLETFPDTKLIKNEIRPIISEANNYETEESVRWIPLELISRWEERFSRGMENLKKLMDKFEKNIKPRLLAAKDLPENCREQINSISALIEQAMYAIDLSASFMKADYAKEPVDINEIVEEIRGHYKEEYGKEVNFSGGKNLPQLDVHRNGLKFILYRIISNGIKEGTSGAHEDSETQVDVKTELTDKEIVITITNEGAGIPDDLKKEIFKYAFSTRSSSGLGLFISKSIAADLGWTVEEVGEEGKEAKFVIRIPAKTEKREESALSAALAELTELRESAGWRTFKDKEKIAGLAEISERLNLGPGDRARLYQNGFPAGRSREEGPRNSLPDKPDAVNVRQHQYGITRSDRPSPYLKTYHAGGCVVVTLWDKETRTGMLAHVDTAADWEASARDITAELEEYGVKVENLEARVIGGRPFSSERLIIDIFASLERMEIPVVETDVLAMKVSVDVILDTANGRVYDIEPASMIREDKGVGGRSLPQGDKLLRVEDRRGLVTGKTPRDFKDPAQYVYDPGDEDLLKERLRISANMFFHGEVEMWNVSLILHDFLGEFSVCKRTKKRNSFMRLQTEFDGFLKGGGLIHNFINEMSSTFEKKEEKDSLTRLERELVDSVNEGQGGYLDFMGVVKNKIGVLNSKKMFKRYSDFWKEFDGFFSKVDKEMQDFQNKPDELKGDLSREELLDVVKNIRMLSEKLRDILSLFLSRFPSAELRNDQDVGLVSLMKDIRDEALGSHLETNMPNLFINGIPLEKYLETAAEEYRLTAIDVFALKAALARFISNGIHLGVENIWCGMRRDGEDTVLVLEDDGTKDAAKKEESEALIVERDSLGRQKMFRPGVSGRKGGGGTGMALAWHIIKMMGGTIEAGKSEKHSGAKFIIRLPAEVGARPPIPNFSLAALSFGAVGFLWAIPVMLGVFILSDFAYQLVRSDNRFYQAALNRHPWVRRALEWFFPRQYIVPLFREFPLLLSRALENFPSFREHLLRYFEKSKILSYLRRKIALEMASSTNVSGGFLGHLFLNPSLDKTMIRKALFVGKFFERSRALRFQINHYRFMLWFRESYVMNLFHLVKKLCTVMSIPKPRFFSFIFKNRNFRFFLRHPLSSLFIVKFMFRRVHVPCGDNTRRFLSSMSRYHEKVTAIVTAAIDEVSGFSRFQYKRFIKTRFFDFLRSNPVFSNMFNIRVIPVIFFETHLAPVDVGEPISTLPLNITPVLAKVKAAGSVAGRVKDAGQVKPERFIYEPQDEEFDQIDIKKVSQGMEQVQRKVLEGELVGTFGLEKWQINGFIEAVTKVKELVKQEFLGLPDLEKEILVWQKLFIRFCSTGHKRAVGVKGKTGKEKMRDILRWLCSDEAKAMGPIDLASEFFVKWVRRQPLIDGNKRTASLLMNYILLTNGFPTFVLNGSNVWDYHRYCEDFHEFDSFLRKNILPRDSGERFLVGRNKIHDDFSDEDPDIRPGDMEKVRKETGISAGNVFAMSAFAVGAATSLWTVVITMAAAAVVNDVIYWLLHHDRFYKALINGHPRMAKKLNWFFPRPLFPGFLSKSIQKTIVSLAGRLLSLRGRFSARSNLNRYHARILKTAAIVLGVLSVMGVLGVPEGFGELMPVFISFGICQYRKLNKALAESLFEEDEDDEDKDKDKDNAEAIEKARDIWYNPENMTKILAAVDAAVKDPGKMNELDELIRTLTDDELVAKKLKKTALGFVERGKELYGFSSKLVEYSEDNFDQPLVDKDKHNIEEQMVQAITKLGHEGDLKGVDFNNPDSFNTFVDKIVDFYITSPEIPEKERLFSQDEREELTGALKSDAVRPELEQIANRYKEEIKEKETKLESNGAIEDMGEQKSGIVDKAVDAIKDHSTALLIFLAVGLSVLTRYVFGWSFTAEGVLGISLILALKEKKEETKEDDTDEVIQKYTVCLNDVARGKKVYQSDESYFKSDIGRDLQEALSQPLMAFKGQQRNTALVGDTIIAESLMKGLASQLENDPRLVKKNLRGSKVIRLDIYSDLLEDLLLKGNIEGAMQTLNKALMEKAKREKIIYYVNFDDYRKLQDLKAGLGVRIIDMIEPLLVDANINVVCLSSEKMKIENNLMEWCDPIIETTSASDFRIKENVEQFIDDAPVDYNLTEDRKIVLDEKVLDKAIELARDYVPDGILPNKLVDILDQIISERLWDTTDEELYVLKRDIKYALNNLDFAYKHNKKEAVEYLERLLDELIYKHRDLLKKRTKVKDSAAAGDIRITLEDIVEKISFMTKVPEHEIMLTVDEKLENFLPVMKSCVIGQDEALEKIHKKLVASGFSRQIGRKKEGGTKLKRKPLAFFCVAGTGVGKTETAKQMAKYLFGDERALVRFDMSQYSNENAAARLDGVPSAYVGGEKMGDLTGEVDKRKRCVVLLDEIEKADVSVFEKLLTVLDTGQMKDNTAMKKVDFSRVVFVLTSNVGFNFDSELYANAEKEAALKDDVQRIKEAAKEAMDDTGVFEKLIHYFENIDLPDEFYKTSQEFIEDKKSHELQMKELKEKIIDLRKKDENTTVEEILLEDLPADYESGSLKTKEKLLSQINEAVSSKIEEESYDGAEMEEEISGFAAMITSLIGERKERFDLLLKIFEMLDIKNEIGKIKGESLKFVKEAIGEYEDERSKVPKISPEFMNRIGDGLILFNTLDRKQIKTIVDVRARDINRWLEEKELNIVLSDTLKEHLAEKGYDPKNGARPLWRTIQNELLNPLAVRILKSEFPPGSEISADIKGDKVVFKHKLQKKGKKLVWKNKNETEKTIFQLRSGGMEKALEDLLGKEPAGELEGISPEELGKIALPELSEKEKEQLKRMEESKDPRTLGLYAKIMREYQELEKHLENDFICLTTKNLSGKIDDVYSDTGSVSGVFRILSRQRQNIPYVVGNSGIELQELLETFVGSVGKMGLNASFKNRVFKLDISQLVSLNNPPQAEKLLAKMLDAIERDDEKKGLKTVVWIDADQLDKLLKKARGGVALDLELLFKSAMERFKTIRFIVTSTSDKRVENREFDHFYTLLRTEKIKKEVLRQDFWLHRAKSLMSHGVIPVDMTPEAIDYAFKIIEKYLPGAVATEKILRWLSRIYREVVNRPETIKQIKRNAYDQLQSQLNNSLRKRKDLNHEGLAELNGFMKAVRGIIEAEKAVLPEKLEISEDKIFKVAQEDADIKIPVEERDTSEDADTYLRLEEMISERIKGHPLVIEAISNAIRRNRAGLNFTGAPVGSFILAGPTGVGKTEIALALANLVFGNALVDVYMNQLPPGETGYEALIGSPRGIRGYGKNKESLLTARIMANPDCVILLDEIEKAYWRLFDLLLPALEDGILTDNNGDTAYLNNSLIIMTSNVGLPAGSPLYKKMKEVLLKDDPGEYDKLVREIEQKVREAIKGEAAFKYRPELLNRLTGIFVLKPLTRKAARQIVGRLLDYYAADMRSKGFELEFGRDQKGRDDIIDLLIEEGYEPERGFRSLEDKMRELFDEEWQFYQKDLKKWQAELKAWLNKEKIEITAEQKRFFNRFFGPLSGYDSKNGLYLNADMVTPHAGDKIIVTRPALLLSGKRKLKQEFTFTVERAREIKEEEELTKEEKIILKNLSRAYQEKRDSKETFDLDDMEELTRVVPLVKDEGERLEFSAKSDTARSMEPTLKKDTGGINKEIIQEITDLAGDDPAAEPLKKWIGSAVNVAKMSILQEVMRQQGDLAEDFFSLGRNQLNKYFEKYAKDTRDKDLNVLLSWEKENNELRVKVKFPVRLPRQLWRLLFSDDFRGKNNLGSIGGVTTLTAEKYGALEGILLAQSALIEQEASLGFSQGPDDKTTCFWIALPLLTGGRREADLERSLKDEDDVKKLEVLTEELKAAGDFKRVFEIMEQTEKIALPEKGDILTGILDKTKSAEFDDIEKDVLILRSLISLSEVSARAAKKAMGSLSSGDKKRNKDFIASFNKLIKADSGIAKLRGLEEFWAESSKKEIEEYFRERMGGLPYLSELTDNFFDSAPRPLKPTLLMLRAFSRIKTDMPFESFGIWIEKSGDKWTWKGRGSGNIHQLVFAQDPVTGETVCEWKTPYGAFLSVTVKAITNNIKGGVKPGKGDYKWDIDTCMELDIMNYLHYDSIDRIKRKDSSEVGKDLEARLEWCRKYVGGGELDKLIKQRDNAKHKTEEMLKELDERRETEGQGERVRGQGTEGMARLKDEIEKLERLKESGADRGGIALLQKGYKITLTSGKEITVDVIYSLTYSPQGELVVKMEDTEETKYLIKQREDGKWEEIPLYDGEE